MSSGVGVPTSLRGIFEDAIKRICEERNRRTNVILEVLEHDAEHGNLSSQTISSLLIEEMGQRLSEDSSIFKTLQILAGSIDALYNRVEAHEGKVTNETQHEPSVSNGKELRFVIASWTERRLPEGQT
ncbi:MAG: hypothetical protein ABSD41_03275 [Candidatus Bathyarchaeia archaeon]